MREEQPKHMVPAGDSHRQIGGGVLPAAIVGSALFSAAMATPALAEETTAAEQETNPPVATTAQAPVTAEQTQRQAQRSYDDAAKAAVDAQAKADANRKAASGTKAKATDARTKADAAKGALGDAASKESGAKGALDKAVSDKAAADATAKGAKDALAKARSTEAAAEVDVTKKEATARGAKNALDAAQKAYDSAPEGRKAMTVAEFLDSILHGKYTEWATKGGANEDGVYADIADPSKTGKANGSNMIYANFLKALDFIDYLNKYRTEHGLSPLTVSGYHMAGQMLECDLVDGVDGIQNHTTFGGFASYKDISWGWANPVDGWLRECDVFKKDAESYAKSGESDAAYKTALADVDWGNEPFVHAFYNMHVAKINAYVLKTEGRMHEYGHWTSLTSEDNEYIGMGFNGSPGQAYSNTATAAGSGHVGDDVTGTTDFFRNLARAAESGTSSNKPELKKVLDAAKAASDEATAKANAAQSKADEAGRVAEDAKTGGKRAKAALAAAERGLEGAKASARADALRPRAEGLAGRQAGLDEAARVAQAKADVRRAIADELAKLPSDDALVANPATVDFVIKWLDAYKTDDADVAAAVRDYASRLHAARRSAAHGLAIQGRVDADEKVANEARSKADEAKATLDEANRQLAIKQAIDRAMGETDANADQSASDGAATPGRATAGTYVPKHMSALPRTGDDAGMTIAPLVASGLAAIVAAAGKRHRRRDNG
ncbi:hypothetical protein [Tractidigestivibacter sp.]|uniref:hypothetical protein n=1 Tax=Tractidigestivibacter sp. TaxID=2847320 RepID=UPI002A90FA14|nr:hypothetical protein [Tractidigestivibacter sp.]MDY5272508.1 hypothetical protein [Tractidigestivibacter sp.]